MDKANRVQRTADKLRSVELRPYECRDPGQVLTAVLAGGSLSEGDLLLALVHDPSGDQRILQTIRLNSEHSRCLGSYEGPDILAGYLRWLAVPMRQPGEPPRQR